MAVTIIPAHTLIAEQTLSAAQASVTFSNIPQTYKDLMLEYCGTLSTAVAWTIAFNGDTTNTNYSFTALYGDGTNPGSNRNSNLATMQIAFAGTDQSTNILQIMSYSNSSVYKTVVSRNNGGGYVSSRVGLWRNANAVTSIIAATSSGTFSANGTFRLWGIIG